MHFCIKCSNMLYISLKEENSNELIYYCRNCGYKDNNNIINNKSLSICKSQFNQTNSHYLNILNKYTKLDPTLPRINTIKCPNTECKSNIDNIPREVIYLRYDDINMKYVYLCCNCDYSWTTNN